MASDTTRDLDTEAIQAASGIGLCANCDHSLDLHYRDRSTTPYHAGCRYSAERRDTTFARLLHRFVSAALDLSAEWTNAASVGRDEEADVDAATKAYPSYLPSFDEVADDLLRMAAAVEERAPFTPQSCDCHTFYPERVTVRTLIRHLQRAADLDAPVLIGNNSWYRYVGAVHPADEDAGYVFPTIDEGTEYGPTDA